YVEKLNPLDEEISLQKASIASKNGDHEASIKFLNKALELSEDPLEIWNLLGMEHLLAEEFEEASYFFKNCIKDNPQDYSALYNLLYSYDHLNKINESITVLNEVLEIDPYSEVAWHQLGLVLLKKEQHKEALSAFDFAIISDDTFTGAYIEKGKLLETMGRINEAIDNYEIALNTNDPSAFVFLSIGRCHETLDNSEIAVSFYLKAIHLEPSNENSWISLIEFYISLKQHKKAKDYFKRALEVNSESVELWKKGTQIYKALGQLEKALNAYQKLYDLGVYELPILLNHIDLHLQLKQWDKAFEMTNEAYKTFPESKSLAFRLGGCCMELGKKSEARYFLNVEQLSEEERLELSKLFPSFDQI
ncbi:tetratricopeptide repeat protein, partial [Flavobacteriaceae bacterium]|nr:tetratricopeptide repeat protein [Flavobacteriaceae bacterium]